MKRFLKLAILFPLLVCGSCALNVRQEVSEFVKGFSLINSMTTHKKANLTYSSVVHDKYNIVIGTQDVAFEFSKEDEDNYYSTHTEIASGILAHNDVTKLEISISKSSDDPNKPYYRLIKENDIVSESSGNLTKDEYALLLQGFYYDTYYADSYSGGMYFGDDFLAKIGYQDNITVNHEENTITLKLENVKIEDNIASLYTYTLDSYGMLLDYQIKIIGAESTLTTTMSITY